MAHLQAYGTQEMCSIVEPPGTAHKFAKGCNRNVQEDSHLLK